MEEMMQKFKMIRKLMEKLLTEKKMINFLLSRCFPIYEVIVFRFLWSTIKTYGNDVMECLTQFYTQRYKY